VIAVTMVVRQGRQIATSEAKLYIGIPSMVRPVVRFRTAAFALATISSKERLLTCT
jgi:hypothetical protein